MYWIESSSAISLTGWYRIFYNAKHYKWKIQRLPDMDAYLNVTLSSFSIQSVSKYSRKTTKSDTTFKKELARTRFASLDYKFRV